MLESHAPIAFYDGQLLLSDQVAIPYWDLGFAQGVSVAEQLRTYRGRLPLLEFHLSRLQRGLARLNLECRVALDAIRQNIEIVVDHNHRLLPAGSDLGVCAVVSAGWVKAFAPSSSDLEQSALPRVLIHSFPLPFDLWKDEFRQGVRLARTSIREIPAQSLPHEFKHRSRMHYYLAQQEVDRRRPGCRPLLATPDGFVADSTTAGILVYQTPVGWLAPPPEHALQSVTVEVAEALAISSGIGFTRRAIGFDELASAEEVMCCSSPTGLLPVVECDGRPIGGGRSGPHYAKMAELWSERVELDYRRQVLDA